MEIDRLLHFYHGSVYTVFNRPDRTRLKNLTQSPWRRRAGVPVC